MTERRHRLFLYSDLAFAALLGAFLAVRAWRLRTLYTDADARSGLQTALTALKLDTGWGASAFDLQTVACDASACEATINFRYRANRLARRSENGWILRWNRAEPERYALER